MQSNTIEEKYKAQEIFPVQQQMLELFNKIVENLYPQTELTYEEFLLYKQYIKIYACLVWCNEPRLLYSWPVSINNRLLSSYIDIGKKEETKKLVAEFQDLIKISPFMSDLNDFWKIAKKIEIKYKWSYNKDKCSYYVSGYLPVEIFFSKPGDLKDLIRALENIQKGVENNLYLLDLEEHGEDMADLFNQRDELEKEINRIDKIQEINRESDDDLDKQLIIKLANRRKRYSIEQKPATRKSLHIKSLQLYLLYNELSDINPLISNQIRTQARMKNRLQKPTEDMLEAMSSRQSTEDMLDAKFLKITQERQPIVGTKLISTYEEYKNEADPEKKAKIVQKILELNEECRSLNKQAQILLKKAFDNKADLAKKAQLKQEIMEWHLLNKQALILLKQEYKNEAAPDKKAKIVQKMVELHEEFCSLNEQAQILLKKAFDNEADLAKKAELKQKIVKLNEEHRRLKEQVERMIQKIVKLNKEHRRLKEEMERMIQVDEAKLEAEMHKKQKKEAKEAPVSGQDKLGYKSFAAALKRREEAKANLVLSTQKEEAEVQKQKDQLASKNWQDQVKKGEDNSKCKIF